jgi:hypothetical protein
VGLVCNIIGIGNLCFKLDLVKGFAMKVVEMKVVDVYVLPICEG